MSPLSDLCLSLGNVIATDFDPRPEEGLGQFVDVDAEQVSHLLSHGVVRKDGLVGVTLLTKLHIAKEQDSGNDLPDGAQVLVGDSHDLHGVVRGLELLGVVTARNSDISMTEECVVLGFFKDVPL